MNNNETTDNDSSTTSSPIVATKTIISSAQHEEEKSQKNNSVTLLVLGDGDFSFSFDWARYLLVTQKAATTIYPQRSLHLLATGLDSKESLLQKYKDSTFLLKGLTGLDQTLRSKSAATTTCTDNSGNSLLQLHVSVHHGVNAILPVELASSSSSTHNNVLAARVRAQHVVFHHPHLGTEDAVLHAQFLCHLFHSVSTGWLLKPNEANDDDDNTSYFHLTLVKGQFARWKCQEAADRHGMILVDQRPFRPPNVENPYYQHRRHQTGRSFAARAPEGSEVYTFTTSISSDSKNRNVGDLVSRLLDLGSERDSVDGDNDKPNNSNNSGVFACLYCEKTFREERSRKCHVKAVHHDGDKKRKRDDGTAYACSLCRSSTKDGGPRLFQSAQALEDHQKAKHLAKHDEIKPDWHTPASSSIVIKRTEAELPDTTNNSEDLGKCEICGLMFTSTRSREDHKLAFVPSDIKTSLSSVGSSKPDLLPFACIHCKHAFREQRAQKQHENFCKAKPSS